MIETIVSAIKQMVDLPQPVLAMIAGTLGSWAVTQKAKFLVPAQWSAKARELWTQGIAFALGFAITFAAFPWDNQPAATIAGLLVGLWSPALWNLAMFLVGLKWPALAAKLSQSTRQ